MELVSDAGIRGKKGRIISRFALWVAGSNSAIAIQFNENDFNTKTHQKSARSRSSNITMLSAILKKLCSGSVDKTVSHSEVGREND